MPRSSSKARKASPAPTGRNISAQGIVLGPTSLTNSSPEGATEALGQCETGEKLLAAVLAKRELDHHGVGKYRQPVGPAIDDPSQLPSHWTWVSPDQLSAASRNSMAIGPFGSNLKVSDYRKEGVPLVFVRHIRSESFTETHYVTHEKAGELTAHSVAGGDLLITKMGEPPGDSAIYPKGGPDAIITADCIKWRLAPVGVDPNFFKYALRTETTKKQIAKRTRGVAQKKVSLERFKDIALPLPPLPEQRRIVARIEELFSRLDAGVAALRHAKAQLQRYRQSVLAAAVTGQLTQAWREQQGVSLERWTDTTLGEIAEIIDPNPSHRYPSYDAGTVPLMATKQMDGHDGWDPSTAKLTTDAFYESRKAEHGFQPTDIIFARKGRLGLARRPPDLPKYAFSHTVFIIRGGDQITPEYLLWILRPDSVVTWLLREMNAAAGVPTLGKAKTASLPVRLPPIDEQHQIVTEVEARTTAIDHLEAELDRQITRSNRLRQSTLAAAFAGAL